MTATTPGVAYAPSSLKTRTDEPTTASAGPDTPLSLREAAIVALIRTGTPMSAAQIVTRIEQLGLAPQTRTRTPAQSVNRDLHTAVRRGDPRITTGPEPGQFAPTGQTDPTPRTDVTAPTRPVDRRPVSLRLPVEPLQDAVETAQIRFVETADGSPTRARALYRTYRRSVARGWIHLFDADEISISILGAHPCVIWGDGWWETMADADRYVRAARTARTPGDGPAPKG